MSLRDEMWEAELGRYLDSLRPDSPESKKWQARNAGYLAVCPTCPHVEQKSEGDDTTWSNTLNLRSNLETLRREAGLSDAVPEPQKASTSQVGGDHYSKLLHQPWDILQERLGPEGFKAYLLGTVVAYLIREKNGLEDLEKARHTLDRLIELETDGRR